MGRENIKINKVLKNIILLKNFFFPKKKMEKIYINKNTKGKLINFKIVYFIFSTFVSFNLGAPWVQENTYFCLDF